MSDTQRTAGPTTAELVAHIAGDVSTLVRDELRLAQAETTAKLKKAGVGAGMLGTAGVIALFGGGALVAAAILALALVMDPWGAALLVGLALLLVAGVAALIGKRRGAAGTPPLPTDTVGEVRADVATIREGIAR